MGLEEDRDDWWRGRDPGPHSKRAMLLAVAEAGGMLSGVALGREVPYYGAFGHLEELRSEGLVDKSPEQPIRDLTLWLITDAGRREASK